MQPFRGLFEPIPIRTNGEVDAVFDTSMLFAIICYGVGLMLVNHGLDWLSRRIHAIDVSNRLRDQRIAYASNRAWPPPDLVGQATATPAGPAPIATEQPTR